MSHEAAVVDMGVVYRPLSLADIEVRPTAADCEELFRLEEWNKNLGTFAKKPDEVNVLESSGGCLALWGQPAVKVLLLFILFWVFVVAMYCKDK